MSKYKKSLETTKKLVFVSLPHIQPSVIELKNFRNDEDYKTYGSIYKIEPAVRVGFRIMPVLFFVFIIMINLNCAGCPYSFTGSSVPSHLKTIGISLFDDQSNFGEAGLREKITRAITEKFVNDNTLTVTDKGKADATLEGTIERIIDKPATIASGEKVNKRRIEISIKAIYTDMVKRKKIWEKEFTNWGDYISSGSTFTQRQEGLNTAIDKISEDILLQIVSGW